MAALGGKTNESPSCSKERSYESTSSERGQFCDQHAAESIVGVQNNICAYSGCFRHRSHGVARSRRSEFCPEHVVDVVVRISCKEELEDSPPEQPEPDVDVVVRISCKEELEDSPPEQPEPDVPGDNSATEAYSAPASDDMVDVVSRQCAGENCLKGSVFGFEGGQKAIFCADHAMGGMVDITQRTFSHEVVRKGPSSGIADTDGNVLYRPGGAPAGSGSVAVASWGYSSAGSPIGRSHSSAAIWKGEGFAGHTSGGILAVASKKCRREGCSQMPSYGAVNGSNRTNLCVTHANDDTVAVPAVANEEICLREGCRRPRTGGLGATGNGELCFEHGTLREVNTAGKRSRQKGCLSSPSKKVSTTGKQSRQEGCVLLPSREVSTTGKRCRQEGCLSLPSYGLAGSTTYEYCPKHRLDGMVDNSHKTCGGKGCSKTPTFIFPGVRGKRLCPKHAVPGMVLAQCAHDNCIKRPTFGTKENRTRTFCAEHALEGMVDKIKKTCAQEGCVTKPSYGPAGTNSGVLCAKHAPRGMVNVVTKKCAHPGCLKAPSYGVAGSSKREFCAPHKIPGMVDIYKMRCHHQGCSKMPSFGSEENRKWEFCGEHAAEGMVSRDPRRGSSGRRARRARVPRLREPNPEQTGSEGDPLAEVAGGT